MEKQMKQRSRSRLTSGLSLVLLALAMLATTAVQPEPAAANITETSDWILRSTDAMSSVDGYDGNDLSGVTVDSNGGIYAVDNNTNAIYCLSNPSGNNWQAEKVVGVDWGSKDMEGIAAVRRGRFAVAWEDNGSSDASGVTEIFIDGLTSHSPREFELPQVFEETTVADDPGDPNDNDNFDDPADGVNLELGGAEGIVFRHGEDKFWMVQEGKHGTTTVNGQEVDIALPTLWRVDTRDVPTTTQPVTLKDQDGNRLETDASGVAKEPGDRYDDTLWVVSEKDRQIRKFDNEGNQLGEPIDSQLQDPEGIAFFPDGVHMIVVGEGSDIAIFSQSASIAPLPRGNCTGKPAVCTPFTVATTASTVGVGETFDVTVNLGSCNATILRTEFQVSGHPFIGPWQTHDVNGRLDSHTFTMTAEAEGAAQVQAVLVVDYASYVDDGSYQETLTSDRVVITTPVTVTADASPSPGQFSMQNQRTSDFLVNAETTVRAQASEGDGTDWILEEIGNGNVYVKSVSTGEYIDLDLQSRRVNSLPTLKATAETGSEWKLIQRGDGSYHIENADYTGRQYGRNRLTAWSGGVVRVTGSTFPQTRWDLLPAT